MHFLRRATRALAWSAHGTSALTSDNLRWPDPASHRVACRALSPAARAGTCRNSFQLRKVGAAASVSTRGRAVDPRQPRALARSQLPRPPGVLSTRDSLASPVGA